MANRRILLVESDAAAAAYLGNLLRQTGYGILTAPSGKEGLIAAWRERPDMLIITAELPDLNGLDIVRKLRADARTAKTRLILLSTRNYPQDILNGVQAGADEYIVKRPGADAELLERVRALLPASTIATATLDAARLRGKLLVFMSAKGGTGTSSLCVNVAQMLARKAAPKTVAVVDLVLPLGSLSYIVGVEAADRNVIAASRLESRHITAERLRPLLLRRDEWGFDLLAGATDPDAAQGLRIEHLEPVLLGLRQAYDFVVVDFGRALSRVSLPVIRQAAKTIIITSADAATVALTKTMLAYLDKQEVRRQRLQVVLNRAVGLEGLSRSELERELSLTIAALVPHLAEKFSLANNQHQPLSLKFPNETATFTLQSFADGLLDQLTRQPDAAAPQSA